MEARKNSLSHDAPRGARPLRCAAFRCALRRAGLGLGFAVCVLLAACSEAPRDMPSLSPAQEREIEALYDDIARTELALSPETVTRLGVEAGPGLDANARLDERSQARFERTRLIRLELLERLRQVAALPDGSQAAADIAVVRGVYEAITRLEAFGFGRYELRIARPYAIDHLSGAWLDVSSLITARQRVRDRADALALVARLESLGGAISDERRRLIADAEAGVVPPRAVLQRLSDRLSAFIAPPPGDHELARISKNLVSGAMGLGTTELNRLQGRIDRAIAADIYTETRALIATIDGMIETAQTMPGIWTIPDGDRYYRALLGFHIAPDLDPDALHQEGLASVEALSDELDAALNALWIREGSVSARLARLAEEPAMQLGAQSTDASGRESGDTINDEGAAEVLLETGRAALDRSITVLPDLFVSEPPRGLQIAAMPPARAAASTGARYVPAPVDASLPARVELDTSEPGRWPLFSIPTVIYHEGLPGHHAEAALAGRGTRQPPLIRQLIWNTAFGEGWAVYAEDLADETGLYEYDPMGRIGYLQSLLLRAARLVADTGIHSRRWTHDEAVDYLVSTTGLPRPSMEAEVDQIAAWPGHAAAYLAGRNRLRDLRLRARAVLGEDFSLQEFNTVILAGGPRPLSIVERDIETWYGAKLEQGQAASAGSN